jgi:predicted GIY-YIG superfamily endonuclease
MSMAVYLLHFDVSYKHARHYLGFTYDLGVRLHQHQSGKGARLMEVITAAGIGWHLARTWEHGDRELERTLKHGKNSPRLCPTCVQARVYQRVLHKGGKHP